MYINITWCCDFAEITSIPVADILTDFVRILSDIAKDYIINVISTHPYWQNIHIMLNPLTLDVDILLIYQDITMYFACIRFMSLMTVKCCDTLNPEGI